MASKLDKLRKMNEQRSKTPVAERETPVDALFNNNSSDKKSSDSSDVTDNKKSVKKDVSSQKSSQKENNDSLDPTSSRSTINSADQQIESGLSESSSPSNNIQSEEPVEQITSAKDPSTKKKNIKSSSEKKSTQRKQKKALERYIGNAIDLSDSKIASWMCRIDESLYIRFQLLMAMNSTTKSEMINRILAREQEWALSHPEFPDINFKVDALKSKTKASDSAYITTSFALTNENHAFVKEMSAKCLMKMYAYVSYVIEQYCDLADIPKEL